MKSLIIFLSLALTGAAYAGSTHTYNSATNKVTTVCDLGATKLTFEYPNPAGSSNFTNAGSVLLLSSEDIDGVVTTYNLNATQLFLSKFYGPNSYGNAVSGLFVDSNAEIILGLNSYTQAVWGKAAGEMGIEHSGICLFETGE